jgi:pimeloyl-ACP methyl ester carboxylesterase
VRYVDRDVSSDDSSPTHATSRDGIEIAYWTSGSGPPLVRVHGAPADHTRWQPLLPYLEPQATVHAIDRRGRGQSGDGREYHFTREFEDVAAVVDAVMSALRAQPSWQARVALAHTLPRELRATSEARFDPEQAAKITVPTLLLTGDQSSDPMGADTQTVAAALPDARIVVLAGQEHVADVLAPELFAQHVLAFLREGR